MRQLKKILRIILPEFLYNFIRIIYRIFSKRLISAFFQSFFFKKKIDYINQNLIIISQIQRSGGTLLTQLFDNHSTLYSYPSELMVTSPKFNWRKDFCFSTVKINEHLRECFIKKNYSKLSINKPKTKTESPFYFNPFIERKIYKSYEKYIKKNDIRSKFNSYFTAFFNSFTNYNNLNTKKKYITAFIPRFIMSKYNVELFFKIYPKGYLISIIRDPETWLMSALKHAPEKYKDIKLTLDLWSQCLENSLELKKRYREKVILIKFSDLLMYPEKTLKKICLIINIDYEKQLIMPTFNGQEIDSNSSHKTVKNIIDLSPIISKKKNSLSVEDNKILSKFIKEYKNFESTDSQ